MTEETGFLDYSRIFYLGSAFFAVLSVLYFGFEYLQELSAVSVATAIFAVFLLTFVRGTTRDNKGIKFAYFLSSAGSYLVFILYSNIRIITSENGVLFSLIFSAFLFSGIGYLLTNKRQYLPDKDLARKIYLAVIIFVVLLFVYDAAFVGVTSELNLEDSVTLNAGEETVLGTAVFTKTGLLPINVDGSRAQFCTTNGTAVFGIGSTNVGDFTSSWSPETRSDNLTVGIEQPRFDQFDNFDSGDSFEVRRVDNCPHRLHGEEDVLDEGEIGVELELP